MPPERGNVIVLRTDLDRIVVTPAYARDVFARRGSLTPLLYLEGDTVRDLMPGGRALLVPPARWASVACAADDLAAGRSVRHHWRSPRDKLPERDESGEAR
jgi:hypothetical protein